MCNKIKNIVIAVLSVIVIILSILVVLQKQKLNVVPEPITITDSIVVTKFKDKIIYKEHYDTIVDVRFVYVDSSGYKKDVILQDTINIPIEHKVAEFTSVKDSLELNQKIFYSGWKASIDSTNIDYHFTYKSVPERNISNKRNVGWSFVIGPSIGYDVMFLQNGTYNKGFTIGINATFGIGFTKKFN